MHENTKPDKDALIKLLIKSRADSTVKRYSSEIAKYQKWCHTHEVAKKFPVNIPTAVAYIYSCFLQSHSPSATVTAHAASKWLHSFPSANIQNPFDSSICCNLLESVKRAPAPPTRRKLSVSPQIVRKIVDKYGQNDASLTDLRIACLCLIGYAGLLRYNELSNIRVDYIKGRED